MRGFIVGPALMALLAAAVLPPRSVAAQGTTRGQETPEGRGIKGPYDGQQAGRDAPLATRIFTIRYRDVDDVYLLISRYLGPRGSIRSEPHRKTLTVADAALNLDRIAGMIATYDVPPRSVEVAVQLIMASAGGPAQAPAPPPIRGVIDKLNALNTRWKDYRLVGGGSVLGMEGERSQLAVGDDYRVDFRIDRVSEEDRVIRFKPFELRRRELSVEGNESFSPVINTVLNLRDSQVFIVGASRAERSNRALFMTITASVREP